MKNAKNKIVLFLMVLTVVVSGCTGGNQEDEKEGSSSVTVTEFSPFPNPVPATQNVQFRMELKNDGGADAENVYARLYNPPFGDSGDQVWKTTGTDSMSSQYRTLEFDTLRSGGDQTPAVPKTRQQDFEAPNLADNRDVDYTFKSYVTFDYSTTGNAEVRIMGSDTYRDEGSPQGSAGLENSRGPVQMEVRTPTPIPIYDSGDDEVTKQFCVIVRNQGSGVPFNPSVDPRGGDGFPISETNEKENEVQVRIEDVGNVEFQAGEDETNYQTISILDGKGVGCWDMTISGVSDALERTAPIRVDATYGYKKQTNANSKVQGRGAFDGSGGGGDFTEIAFEGAEGTGSSSVDLTFSEDIDPDSVASSPGDDFNVTNSTDKEIGLSGAEVTDSGSVNVTMNSGDSSYTSGNDAEIEIIGTLESNESSRTITSGTEEFELP